MCTSVDANASYQFPVAWHARLRVVFIYITVHDCKVSRHQNAPRLTSSGVEIVEFFLDRGTITLVTHKPGVVLEQFEFYFKYNNYNKFMWPTADCL